MLETIHSASLTSTCLACNIWVFPKIRVPPNQSKSSILIGFSVISYKPSILRYQYFWKQPSIPKSLHGNSFSPRTVPNIFTSLVKSSTDSGTSFPMGRHFSRSHAGLNASSVEPEENRTGPLFGKSDTIGWLTRLTS